MRIIFLGSPDFALPSLDALVESEHEIVAVFTQPDRPVGRGRRLAPPPVKVRALAAGLDVRQPASVSRPEVVDELRRMAPDVMVIAAYGQILRQRVLDVPPLGVLNVHASLLPRWRGASPVAAAILAGDGETGATIMKVQRELDAGPILDAVALPIRPDHTTGTLTAEIAAAGAKLLIDVLPRWAAGEITPREQDESQATYAPPLKKEDALLDWERDSAEAVWRKTRAYNPWPCAYTYIDGAPLRILDCTPLAHDFDAQPGTVFTFTGVEEQQLMGAGFGVVCAQGEVGVVTVQPPGGRPMRAADYVNGHREIIGKRLRTRAAA
jgi:methionyl-tRNA formyltransferase